MNHESAAPILVSRTAPDHRYVSVRYLVPVYATVDLDADGIPETDAETGATFYRFADGAVVDVCALDEGITLADGSAGAHALAGSAGDPSSAFDVAYESEGDNVDPGALTPAERERALAIADGTLWPSWRRS